MFEIGSSLREARLRQGLDFAEIEQATKIRAKHLRALEDEQFDLLPGQTYVKGFLRTYADYLGLDGQLYVDEFNSRYAAGEEEPAPVARSSVQRRVRRVESRPVLFALLAIAAATALVILAWRSAGPNETRAPVPKVPQAARERQREQPPAPPNRKRRRPPPAPA
ncbi:MAG: helix-turn-helix domain-containing protein, partial [Actinomycetota bacterium]|nr:helix-turn-helix domain-containing protein [Actinomycetota bacterium]